MNAADVEMTDDVKITDDVEMTNAGMIRWGGYPDVKTKQERAVEVIFTNGDKLVFQPAAMSYDNAPRPFAYLIKMPNGQEISIPSSAVLMVNALWVPAKKNG